MLSAKWLSHHFRQQNFSPVPTNLIFDAIRVKNLPDGHRRLIYTEVDVLNKLTNSALGHSLLAILALSCVVESDAADSQLERVPQSGLQPQIVRGNDGTIHLLFFRGEAANGDLFYCRRSASEQSFSTPLRVNSESQSAIATGTIRGGQIALGSAGRVHVAWNGSRNAKPAGPKGETPLLFTRLNDAGTAFEPQQNLIDKAYGLDGGCCLAADGHGKVYVAWHAGDGTGEESRRVWLKTSTDDGATFSAERSIDANRAGVCGCCGMFGSVAENGEVMFLYRSAKHKVDRDTWLLTSATGQEFQSSNLHGWKIEACPMSSYTLAHQGQNSWAAWETNGQIYLAQVRGSGANPHPVAAPGKAGQRKHPRLTLGANGRMLLVWTEGTGWNRGGGLAWQEFDSAGRPTDERGRADGIPVWSFAGAWQDAANGWHIIY